MRAFLLRILTLSLICGFVSGCGSDGPPLAEVTGRVFFNGEPVVAEVIFEPVQTDAEAGGRISSQYTDSNGRFRLQHTIDQPGALVGRHQVTLNILPKAGDSQEMTFADATTPIKIVKLERFVNQGENEFYFAITP